MSRSIRYQPPTNERFARRQPEPEILVGDMRKATGLSERTLSRACESGTLPWPVDNNGVLCWRGADAETVKQYMAAIAAARTSKPPAA